MDENWKLDINWPQLGIKNLHESQHEKGTKGARMTGDSIETEYPLLCETLDTDIKTW